MSKPRKRWGRLDEENKVVEFTRVDPTGRFHPSLKWIEVDEDTKWGTKITLFGSEIQYDPNTVIGVVDLHQLWLESEKRRKEAEEKMNQPQQPKISEYTIDLDPELKGF